MASPALKAAPSPAEIDLLAFRFQALEECWNEAKAGVATAAEPLGKLKQELIDLVRACGGSHKEKSKILHGILWELMATFGQSTTQDAAAIERLRLALVKAKQARLLKKLFRKEISWRFESSAATIIRGEKLSAKLMSLVLECSVTTDRTPTLDVRKKKAA
jgi:hypothetical protein